MVLPSTKKVLIKWPFTLIVSYILCDTVITLSQSDKKPCGHVACNT